MKLYSFYTSIIVFLLMGNINAQSTGYMGKRFVLNYGFHASPVTFGANANNRTLIGTSGSAETGVFALNMIHEGSLEVAISSKWMVNFSGRYYKTAYDNAEYLEFNQFNQYYGSYDYYSGRPEGYYNITGLSYTLYFKYYGRRYVAPWGRYVMFGPVMNTVKTSYDPAVMYLNTNNSYNGYSTGNKMANFGPLEQKFKGFNLMLGWGRSRIIANRIVVDYGCNTQILSVVSGVFNVMLDGEIEELINGKITNTNYIAATNKRRVRGVNFFNAFIKVGVLLF